MNVLVISQYFPPDMGGGATRAYNVVKGLIMNGCEVKVIAAFPHYPDGYIPERYRWKAVVTEKENGIDISRTYVPPIASHGIARRLILFMSFIISSLFAFFIVNDFDIVWAANPNLLSMIPAKIFGWIRKRPVVMNVDDLWTGSLFSRRENTFLMKTIDSLSRFMYSQADMITPISPGYVDVIHKKYNVGLEKIHVVRGGVDLDIFGRKEISSDHQKNFRVLYIGAFSVAYDFNQVLMAAKALESVGEVEFVLQGGGELLGLVEKNAMSLGLSNVKVIDKIVSRDEVAMLLHEAEALILPLKKFSESYRGISSKLYEYQAAGKPIICCSDGMSEQYVSDTKSGVTVKPGDYKDLVKQILYLKNNIDVAEEFGNKGKTYVKENLSIDKIGLHMKKVFDQIICVKELQEYY